MHSNVDPVLPKEAALLMIRILPWAWNSSFDRGHSVTRVNTAVGGSRLACMHNL